MTRIKYIEQFGITMLLALTHCIKRSCISSHLLLLLLPLVLPSPIWQQKYKLMYVMSESESHLSGKLDTTIELDRANLDSGESSRKDKTSDSSVAHQVDFSDYNTDYNNDLSNSYQADIFDNRIPKDEKFSHRLLRPSPSDELPNKGLIMPPTSTQSLPKDLDFQFVSKILGEDYDPNFMSESRPLESILKPNGSIDFDYKKTLPKDSLPEELKHLTFNVPGKSYSVRIKSKKQRRKLRNRLWEHISCPVVYKWKDLGQLFWPRWVKEGDCYKQKSCSFPAGMKCQVSERTEKTFLFWHCRTRNNRSNCRWIKIQYPMITKCKCGC